MGSSFIGHVTLDLFERSQQWGGSSLYGSLLMSRLSKDVCVTTAAASNFSPEEYPNIEWHVQPSDQSTTYQLEYKYGQRFLRLLQKAQPIRFSTISKKHLKTDMTMVCPVVDEVTSEILESITSDFISLVPQGWFRSFDQHGVMSQARSLFQSLPKKIQLIVVSRDDMSMDTSAWDWMKKYAQVAVCTMGKEGYILTLNQKEQFSPPLEVMEEKNPTGCGDIFATSLMFLLHRGVDPVVAAQTAGHAAGLSSTKENLLESIDIAAEFLRSKI